MKQFLHILQAFEEAKLRYVLVGGVAAAIYGRLRFTADLDFVVSLDTENLQECLATLQKLGLQPRLPVDAADLLNPDKRREWVEDRNMVAFPFYDPQNAFIAVDLLLDSPIAYQTLEQNSELSEIDGIPVRVCSRENLIELKRFANRAVDQEDLRFLEGQ